MRTFIIIHLLFISSFSYGQSQTFLPAVQWERLLGGNESDCALDLIAEAGGSIVAVGRSYSTDGDVSGHHGDSTSSDGWIVKLNASGNILWQRSVGGTLNDEFAAILATADGGYLCAGSSSSADMDVPANNGLADAWLVKLSATGDIEWSRNYGNNLINSFVSACVMDDGNIAAIMESKPDLYPWTIPQTSVIKFDPQGNILWQTVAGTGKTIVETDDRRLLTSAGILFDGTTGATSAVIWNMPSGGASLKKISGIIYAVVGSYNGSVNLAGHLERTGENTYNFVSRVWATDFSSGDEFGFQTSYVPLPKGMAYLSSSDSYVVSGWVSHSSRGGTYEYGVLSTGGEAAFIPTINRDEDRLYSVCALNNGDEFVCAGGRHDGVRNKFWVVKYSMRNIIRGNVFFDQNNNNIQDAGEPPFNNVLVRSVKNVQSTFNKTINGVYSNFVDTGFYTTSPVLSQLPYYTVSPANDTVTFSSFKNIATSNFAVQKIADARDYTVSLAAYSPARPGFPVQYKITCTNKGTDTIVNKTIQFIKDSHLQLVQTNPLFDALSGDTLLWNVNNIAPGEEAVLHIDMTVGTSSPVSIGDTLISYAFIDSTGDINPADNSDVLLQQVTGSFDPNDKTEIRGGQITKLEVENGEYLEYTIRFQNTGNDTAFNVIVRDTLDSRLQWSSAEAISASHPYSLKVMGGRNVECLFQDIQLVDSLRNEPGSHGFITYRIRPKTNLAVGDVVRNSASIYFDFNAPVKTNTQITTVVRTTATWNGAVDSLWDNPGNWNIKIVPDAETVVIIPANVPNNPLVNINAACYALRVDKNGIINIREGYNLEVTGK